VGSGHEVSIAELAGTSAEVTGFGGRLVFDSSKPDGTPRKLLDPSRLTAMGWHAQIALESGLRESAAWYAAHS
jgi:GDP-L-fucose synthase